jgi:hypothetical protein
MRKAESAVKAGTSATLEDAIMEEEEFSQNTANVGIMLIGSLTFMMAMFYFTHHPDPDMKRYSWEVRKKSVITS